MERLNTVLQIQEPIPTLSKDELESTDPNEIFQAFVNDCNHFSRAYKEVEGATNLSDELDALLEKHSKINDTINNIIPPLKEYLTSFNTRLSEYTSELGFIRNKSGELKNLLDFNSKKLSEISPLVNDLIIPPSVINDIISGKINKQWQDNIGFVRDKEAIYAKYRREPGDSNEIDGVAATVVHPKDFYKLVHLLEILKSIILERSKQFLLSKIRLIRSAKPIPCQKVQMQMLQVKEIFKFLLENNYSLALEIRQAYAYSMRWYYKQYFGRYIRSLTILQFKPIDTQYTLGNVQINSNSASNSNSTSLFSSYLSTSYNFKPTITTEKLNEYFQIRKRLLILTQEDNTVMVSQIAENNNNKDNFIEVGFKNLNLALLDNCTVEFNFLRDFFQISDNFDEVRALLEQIFQPTFVSALTYVENVLSNTNVYDVFGTLICIRIANQLIEESKIRGLAIDSYFSDQLLILWPKFQKLMDWQSESLSKLSGAQLKLPESSDLSTPCDLTISFTYFLQSLLTLSTHTFRNDAVSEERESTDMLNIEGSVENSTVSLPQDVTTPNKDDLSADNIGSSISEPLSNSINRIRNAFEIVMTKIGKSTKSPERFLSINYLYIYNSIQQQHLSLLSSNELYQSEDENPILGETEKHYETLVKAFNQY